MTGHPGDRRAPIRIGHIAAAALLAIAMSASAWAEVYRPRRLESQALTPADLDGRLADLAGQFRKEGRGPGAYFVNVTWPGSAADYRALGGNAIVLTTVVTATAEELPVKRVYFKESNGREWPTHAVISWRSDIAADGLLGPLGRYREDRFDLAPAAMSTLAGQLLADWGENTGVVLLPLPTKTGMNFPIAMPPTDPVVNRPALCILLARSFPGFPTACGRP